MYENIKAGSLITADMLLKMGACSMQVIRFRREWPIGVKIRKKNLMRAADLYLDMRWFGGKILSRADGKRFNSFYFNYNDGDTINHDAAWALWQVLKERK